MSRTHRITTIEHTMKQAAGCYTIFTVAILPLIIYFLQLFGKASTVATVIATALVVLKVAIEYHTSRQKHNHAPAPAPAVPVPHAPLVPYRPPIAGCYVCQKQRPLRPYQFGANYHVGICQECYSSLEATRHRL